MHNNKKHSLGLALAIGLAGAIFATGSSAQEADGAKVWAKGGCASCHGNMADGDNDPAYPQGPSLRRTRLDKDQLKETISCGRPGTPMPYNLADAYTKAACYGLPVGAVPDKTARGAGLAAADIDALVNFLVANVVGKPRVTRGYCAAFNEGNADAPECLQFPR